MGAHRYRFLAEYPDGTMSVYEFATRHGVGVALLRRHIVDGIDGEHVEAVEHLHGDKAHRYLTPDQQRAALAFWDKHGVRYRKRG